VRKVAALPDRSGARARSGNQSGPAVPTRRARRPRAVPSRTSITSWLLVNPDRAGGPAPRRCRPSRPRARGGPVSAALVLNEFRAASIPRSRALVREKGHRIRRPRTEGRRNTAADLFTGSPQMAGPLPQPGPRPRPYAAQYRTPGVRAAEYRRPAMRVRPALRCGPDRVPSAGRDRAPDRATACRAGPGAGSGRAGEPGPRKPAETSGDHAANRNNYSPSRLPLPHVAPQRLPSYHRAISVTPISRHLRRNDLAMNCRVSAAIPSSESAKM
jgi:hypothetical protein